MQQLGDLLILPRNKQISQTGALVVAHGIGRGSFVWYVFDVMRPPPDACCAFSVRSSRCSSSLSAQWGVISGHW